MGDDTIKAQLRAFFLSRDEDVVCAYLFGSLARGQAHGGSDVDVGVLLAEEPPATLAGSGVRLSGDLELQVGRPVDVVLLNRAPVDLVHRVLADGVLIVEHDRAARIRFEVRRRQEYLDLRPILDRYRRAPESARG